MTDIIGSNLGPYQITGALGHGGMADVYRAIQPSIGREVAIKILPAHFLQDRSFLERFDREVKVIAHLQHPRILPVYDYGQHNGLPYIVMAYIGGGTLDEHIRATGRQGLSLDEIARLVGQIAEGLDYAHEKGVIHRDFKPSNVLLDEKGNVHLADFGIAKITSDTAQLTGSGMIGTPAYMAPEMSQPNAITPLVDVYALGITLFEMLTGSQPFPAETPIGVIMAHVTQPIPRLADSGRALPEGLQTVLEKALAKDPAGRYQSTGELSRELNAAISGAPITAASVPTRAVAPPADPGTLRVAPRNYDADTLESPPPPAAPSTPAPAASAGRPGWLVPAFVGIVVLAVLGIAAIFVVPSLFKTPAAPPPAETQSGGVVQPAATQSGDQSSQPAAVSGGPAIGGCPVFPADSYWNVRVDNLPVDTGSADYIDALGSDVGLHPDFGSGQDNGGVIGIPFNVVGGDQAKVPITFEYADESDPGPYPIPDNPQMEAETDRHVLVVDTGDCSLYEVYNAEQQSDGSWKGESGAVWDLSSNDLRPDEWTSADAAGLPILPGLVRYDEVQSGHIDHALRFTAGSIRDNYVWPARHTAGCGDFAGDDQSVPPYGQRFRLKADFDISGFSKDSQVVLTALKEYGMILADCGGDWFISGAPDEGWDNDTLVGDLEQVTGADFEAVDTSGMMVDADSGQAK